jgi:hypothetical protein
MTRRSLHTSREPGVDSWREWEGEPRNEQGREPESEEPLGFLWRDRSGSVVRAPRGEEVGDLLGIRVVLDASLPPGTAKLVRLVEGGWTQDAVWLLNAGRKR